MPDPTTAEQPSDPCVYCVCTRSEHGTAYPSSDWWRSCACGELEGHVFRVAVTS